MFANTKWLVFLVFSLYYTLIELCIFDRNIPFKFQIQLFHYCRATDAKLVDGFCFIFVVSNNVEFLIDYHKIYIFNYIKFVQKFISVVSIFLIHYFLLKSQFKLLFYEPLRQTNCTRRSLQWLRRDLLSIIEKHLHFKLTQWITLSRLKCYS